MKRKLSVAVFFAAAAKLAFTASAGAVDGTIEINQAKVLANGGFPYTISASGGYRLTGDLTFPSGDYAEAVYGRAPFSRAIVAESPRCPDAQRITNPLMPFIPRPRG